MSLEKYIKSLAEPYTSDIFKDRHQEKSVTAEQHSAGRDVAKTKKISALTLGAMGIVFGDIGTSPLYAFREALNGYPLNNLNVYGILSLIFWVLVIIISIKYLLVLLRADSQGEGGIFALLGLLKQHNPSFLLPLSITAMIGAGFLLGDGIITPAVSVLSALEGIEVIFPKFKHLIVPITISILFVLFSQQYRGTARIGALFGPIIVVWFLTIGVLGLFAVLKYPAIWHAIHPKYAISFFLHHGNTALIVLGGVFLVVTGGEALYTDLGHFGRQPIQLGWFLIVLPCLLLNYFGQGALVLLDPSAIANPFYNLAHNHFLIPLLIITTIATIIASQAVISAIFSLVRQAVLLDIIPDMKIVQTSALLQGQIYVPRINLIMAAGTIILVASFGNSSALAAIYGISVNIVMLIVTILVSCVAYKNWKWSLFALAPLFGTFILIDGIFLIANLLKIQNHGWVSLAIGILSVVIMYTWYRGQQRLKEKFFSKRPDIGDMINNLGHSSQIKRVPNLTTVFITDIADRSGGILLQYLKLSHTLPERVIVLNIQIANVPYVASYSRFEFNQIADGFYRLVLHYGFMQMVDIAKALEELSQRKEFGIQIQLEETTFLTEVINITVTDQSQKYLFHWQKILFAFLQHNSRSSIELHGLPLNRTLSVGLFCEI